MLNKFVIVVPCFNEEKRFNENYFNKMVSIRDTFWIFVDDGSTDSTGELLKKFCNKKNTLCLKVNHNIGKSNAIAQGMQYASSKINGISWLGFLDSDGAFEVSDVENIIQMTRSIKVYNAVYSSRVKMAGRNINRNNSRHIFARLIISFFGLVWKDIPYDTQSGFKLYRYSNNFNLIFLEPFKTKWFFDIELFIRNLKILKSTLNAWEEPVSSWVDIPGSKINYRERVRIIHEVVYIFYLLFRQRKSLKPQ